MQDYTYNCHHCYTVTFTNHPISRCPDCLCWEEQIEIEEVALDEVCLTLKLWVQGLSYEEALEEFKRERAGIS